jgi:hypothetical protein
MTGVPEDAMTDFALETRGAQPFSSTVRFAVAVPRAAHVRLSVYDVRGRVVDVLEDCVLPAGRYDVLWDCAAMGGGVSSGVYFVKMEAPGKDITKKVVLVR